MGALRYSDKKRFVEFLDRSNSKNFYEVLKIFYQEILNEWVEEGNKREDFCELRRIELALPGAKNSYYS